jgi:hypothetical protein
VYVFALLAHQNQATLDPLNLVQWEFYVVPTAVLDARERSQHSITLPSLKALHGEPVGFQGLRQAVVTAAGAPRSQVFTYTTNNGIPGQEGKPRCP